eukprot:TRINITY_DN31061_c0_g1_i1.p1 TRINITY_DN31061_c0_g1~~TRINITY_DN31061_c0_g1_i1.p1  ORF type:complete len:432 (-),score=30.38 TRINITY_DN31061_c0_g1_i1:64-1317(-)
MDCPQDSQALGQPQNAPEQVELVVVSLRGEEVARPRLDQDASVRHLKAAISDATGVLPAVQCLSVGNQSFHNDNEIIGVLARAGTVVTLCIYNSSPVWVSPGPCGSPALKITSVCVAGTNIQAHLHESPASILARAIGESTPSQFCTSHVLFWSSWPVEGDAAIRDRLSELGAMMRAGTALQQDCVDGDVAVLTLRARPGALQTSSLLYGLPNGRLFATHHIGESAYGTWGWLRMGETDADTTVAMRLRTASPCGNSEPCGRFLVEYLGSMQRAAIPESISQAVQTYANFLLRDAAKRTFRANDAHDGHDPPCEIHVEMLLLVRGRLTVYEHAPGEACETRCINQFCMLRASRHHHEVIFLPLLGFGALPYQPPPELDSLLCNFCLIPVPGCAHVSHAPTRYDPSWFERPLRRLFFG